MITNTDFWKSLRSLAATLFTVHFTLFTSEALISVAFMSVALPAQAQSQSQQQPTVTVLMTDGTLSEVISEIERTSNYVFMFDASIRPQLSRRVTINMKNRPISEVMDHLLRGTQMEYRVKQRQVMVYQKGNADATIPSTTVEGTVCDEQGEPLLGASVYVKETEVGTMTDDRGHYSIRVPSGRSTLRFTYIGYDALEMTAAQARGRKVRLKTGAHALKEVTVVSDGYNTIDKRLSASSTYTLKPEDFQIQNVPNLSNMLQGTVPGLSVMAPSGSPNAAPKMRMRGSSTIHGDAAPVWVIDGVIWEETVNVSNDEVNAVLRGNNSLDQVNENASLSLLGNAITGLNPHDIESITFLKDASATAIYGTRAANGVIVVKTKKGREGKTQVNFSASLGFTSRPTYEQYDMMNSQERIQLSKDMVQRGYVFDVKPYATGFEGALYDLYDKKISDDEFAARVTELETRNTNWFKQLMQNALNQDYNVNISGGSGQTRYYTSLGYSDARGTSKGDQMRRFNMSMSLDTRLWDFLQVGTKLMFSDRNSDGFYMVNPFDYAIYAARTLAPDEYYQQTQTRIEGTDNNYMLRYNIFNELAHTSNTTNVRQTNAQISLRANILPGLMADGMFAYSVSNTQGQQWADEQSYYISGIRGYEVGAVLPGSADELASRLPRGGILLNDDQKQKAWTARAQLNYNKAFGRDQQHVIQAMIGFEARSNKYEGLKEQEYGYFPDRGNKVSFEYNNAVSGSTDWHGSVDKHTTTIVSTLSNTVSEYGTLVYSLKNRYTLNANLRMDASNRFGQYTNHKFLPVWSVAARWNMADEPWMPRHIVNDLSIRGSYGMQGNIPTSVGPNLVVRYPTQVVNRWSGEYQLNISRLPYPNLRWEKTQTINLGLEWGLLNGRITGTFDYYYKKGTDILFKLPVALEYGQEEVYRNGADLKNYGIELSMTFIPLRTKDMELSITPIWSKNTNRVAAVQQQQTYTIDDYLSGNAYEEGEPVNALYSWKFTGLDPQTGYATFAHTSKTQAGAELVDNLKDVLEYSGQKDPKFNGGFSLAFRYKQWSLNTMWAYALGNVVRLNYMFEGNNLMPQPYNNLSSKLLNAWKEPGDELHTTIPGFNRTGEPDYNLWFNYSHGNTGMATITSRSSYWMYNYSDLRIVKGDFLRCRNLSLNYSVPYKVIQALGINALSMSVNVTNPITFCSSKFEGQDPEIQGTGTTAMPITQTYTFSLNISL